MKKEASASTSEIVMWDAHSMDSLCSQTSITDENCFFKTNHLSSLEIALRAKHQMMR